MGDCDGCPDYQRRIEVYSNSNLGCPADEFVIPVIEPEPEEEPEEEPEVGVKRVNSDNANQVLSCLDLKHDFRSLGWHKTSTC